MTPIPERTLSATSRRGVVTIGCGLLGFVAALMVALIFPLGASQAWGLTWLHGAAAPGTGWGEPFRHLVVRASAQGQPMVALIAAAIVFKLMPTLGALFALRLPDVLAAAVVTLCLVRLAESRSLGLLAVLWFVVSPALWAAVVGTPGLVVDAGAAIALYGAVCRSHRRPGPGAGLVAVLAVAALVLNGAGVYAIAVVLGVYLHTGLVRGEWRLFASLRLTILAGLVVASLTLLDVLVLPEWGRWAGLYQQLGTAIERSGLHLPVVVIAVIVIVPSLVALVESARRPAGAAGRLALILAIGWLVFSAAANTPLPAVIALAPIAVLWWTTPLLSVTPRDRAFWIAGLYVLAGLAGVGALLILGRSEPAASTALILASRAAAIILALASVIWLGVAWRGRGQAPAVAVALVLVAVLAAGALWLAPPQQLLSQRNYDRQLADEIAPLSSRPIAVLAPVEAALWRAELGRPVFVAPNMPALCRWAAGREAAQAPLVLVRPGATGPVLGRFAGARALLQSPGTPQTSVMVIELDTSAARECR